LNLVIRLDENVDKFLDAALCEMLTLCHRYQNAACLYTNFKKTIKAIGLRKAPRASDALDPSAFCPSSFLRHTIPNSLFPNFLSPYLFSPPLQRKNRMSRWSTPQVPCALLSIPCERSSFPLLICRQRTEILLERPLDSVKCWTTFGMD
jgi:hypothetical protein